MSEVNYHQHLYNNLLILHELKPGGPDFVKCVKENMFAKPNRTAFDQVLFYLCSSYDPAKYLPKIPWPVLDRSQERIFRQNTVTFVKEIVKEVTEARLPTFAHSFLSTPGGERLAKFMWKFSLLVLKTVVERENDMIVLQYPTTDLNLVKNITEMNLQELGQDVDSLCRLIMDASIYAKKLNNDIMNQSMELKSSRTEFAELVHSLDQCALNEQEKALLLNGDREQYNIVFTKWQDHLNSEAKEAKTMLKTLKDQSDVIKHCYQTVKSFVDRKTMPIVLDATNFPSNLKDDNGNLLLAHVISEGADAAITLLNSISMFGGFQHLDPVLPALECIKIELQEVKESLAESKAGFIELISETLEGMNPLKVEKASEAPPLKGGLQLGSEMLQDLQTSTPPLLFNVSCDVSSKSRISYESPPIERVVGKMRPHPQRKAIRDDAVIGTPKVSQSTLPGLPSRNLCVTTPFASLLPRKNLQSVKGSTKFISDSSISCVAQTPASFCPKKFATSTVCKSSTSIAMNKTLNHLTIPTVKTTSGRKPGQELKKIPSSKNKEDSKSSINSEPMSPNLLSQEGKDSVGIKHTPIDRGDNGSAVLKPLSEKAFKTTHIDVPKKASVLSMGPDHDGHQSEILEKNISSTNKTDFNLPSPIGVIKDDRSLKSIFNQVPCLETSRGILSKVTSPKIMCSPTASPRSHVANQKIGDISIQNRTPKIVITSNSLRDATFDSPQSSFGMFSPASAENSFFSNEHVLDEPIPTVPKLEFDFEEDISPSGRVSLCPPSEASEPIAVKESTGTVEKKLSTERRRSLQALISRYRELVASSKPVHVSPPVSPGPDLEVCTEDLNIEIDVHLDDINLE